MSALLSAQAADGAGIVRVRQGDLVKSGIFEYSKTGGGTATLELKSNYNGAVLATFSLAAGTQFGSIEVPIPSRYYAELSSVASTVSVDAQMDGD